MLKYLSQCFLVLLIILSPCNGEDLTPKKIKVKDKPPVGFEDLVQPQTTEVDIYYAKEKIGNTLATFTPQTIEFYYPEDVVALIPNLLDPNIIKNALSGPLKTNASEVCSDRLRNDCGTLSPNIAEVIFDESRFRVDVFIGHLQLEPQAISSTKFLPKIVNPKFSSANSIANSFIGEDGDLSYSIGANHIFSYGQSRLNTQWDQSDTRDFRIEKLSYQHDDSGIAKEVGYYNSDTRFTSFTNDLDIVGARVFGSTSTRTDLEYSQATEIFLFLNSRSRVEVFKDDRLIDGGFYEAGNQQLNTNRLSQGSYPITVRITDISGSVREEQFFFVKSAILPPADQALHYFELGILERENSDDTAPNLSNSEFFRLATANRLQSNLGGSLELLHSKDTDLLQGSLNYFGPGYSLQNALMVGTKGEWGAQLAAQYLKNNFALNFSYRQVDSNADQEFEQNDDFDIQILPSDFSQGTLSASTPVYKGHLALRTQYNKTLNEKGTLAYGVEYRYPLFRRNRFTFEWRFSSVVDDDDYNIETGLRITRSSPGQFASAITNYLARETNGVSEQGHTLFANVNNTYENPTYGRTTLGGFVTDELERSSVGARLQNQSSFGLTNIQLEQVNDDNRGDFLRYASTQNTNIITNGNEFAFGGNRGATSGVILKLDGTPINEPFEILIDGQPRGFAKVGKRTVIALSAFQSYDISIRSKSNELLNFDEKHKRVTLYPGNVETLIYEIQPITVLITRILLKNGDPAEFMRIDNAIGLAITDEGGWLQAEISGNEPLQISKKGKVVCTVDLPKLDIQQGVAFVDELKCTN